MIPCEPSQITDSTAPSVRTDKEFSLWLQGRCLGIAESSMYRQRARLLLQAIHPLSSSCFHVDRSRISSISASLFLALPTNIHILKVMDTVAFHRPGCQLAINFMDYRCAAGGHVFYESEKEVAPLSCATQPCTKHVSSCWGTLSVACDITPSGTERRGVR
jgi:hypothetical protein